MDVFAKTGECRGLETGECRGLETSTSRAAGGRTFNTAGGKVAAIVGEAPKRVAMNEWDSLEQAQAFYNSKAWKDLAPHHNRAQKLTRLCAVEAIKGGLSTASHVLAIGRPFESDRAIVCVIF